MKPVFSLLSFILLAFAAMVLAEPSDCRTAEKAADDAPSASNEYRMHFLALCDLAVAEMDKPLAPFFEFYRKKEDPKTHHYPFFMDSYAIRPLCVAYDMTGKKEYLDACTRWADRMVDFQQRMTPKGAYFLNYGKFRQPEQDRGQWFVADSGSIAAAVLAVAVRTNDDAKRKRYLDSIKSFSQMIIDNYVSAGGGVTDGLWSYKGEWWASTAIFGSFMVLAHAETKDPEYLKVALGAVNWLNRGDFHKDDLPAFEAFNPSVVFYCLELYAAALPYIESGSPRRERSEKQIGEALEWLAENQKGRGAKTDWNYLDKGKVYMSGNPYIMYVLARCDDRYRDLSAEADRELRYVDDLLFREGKPRATDLEVWGLMTFGMMSYAEKVCPGELYSTSGPTDLK